MSNPIGDHFPFRIILRTPEFSSGMNRIASGLVRERMKQQRTFQRILRRDQSGDHFKVSAGLFVAPRRAARREPLQPHARNQDRMAVIAAHTLRPLLQENRFNTVAVGLIVEGRGKLRGKVAGDYADGSARQEQR